MTHFYYTFKRLSDDKIILSGGKSDWCIMSEINHKDTKIGDIVKITQFNFTGSAIVNAEIIGKLQYDWDMSKPIGKRKYNEIILGVGYEKAN